MTTGMVIALSVTLGATLSVVLRHVAYVVAAMVLGMPQVGRRHTWPPHH